MQGCIKVIGSEDTRITLQLSSPSHTHMDLDRLGIG